MINFFIILHLFLIAGSDSFVSTTPSLWIMRRLLNWSLPPWFAAYWSDYSFGASGNSDRLYMFVRHTYGATIDIQPVLCDNTIRMCDRPLNNNWDLIVEGAGDGSPPPFWLPLIVSDVSSLAS